jgi:hypothetical protein
VARENLDTGRDQWFLIASAFGSSFKRARRDLSDSDVCR